MCTVTFIARRKGYALGMNRDEKLTRVTALPPSIHRMKGRVALYPSEPKGGTWIGVTDTGVTLALINWYAIARRVAEAPLSRGELVQRALAGDSPEVADRILAKSPLARVNPFRLIGVFPGTTEILEWRWDLQVLGRIAHPWQTAIWISSGFDEAGAQRTRGNAFAEALRESAQDDLDWLRRLHRSHAPNRGPYSVCMHRADAATVSYTEVAVEERVATMTYHPGPPCCESASCVCHLPLRDGPSRRHLSFMSTSPAHSAPGDLRRCCSISPR